MDVGVVAGVFDKSFCDVDAERVYDGFVRSGQGKDGFCDGAVQFSFFNFV